MPNQSHYFMGPLTVKINLWRFLGNQVVSECGCYWNGWAHNKVQMLFPIWKFSQDGEGEERSCVGIKVTPPMA
jgi:hypothetical protein